MTNDITWQPSASIVDLTKRAQIIAKIRQFFTERDYLEVETPVMAHYGITDVHLSNIQAVFRNEVYNLQTSPEYHMKRLLAAGSGPIFQLARVFRDDELGRWHNPEFTLLEWYQLDIDHHDLMLEVDSLLQLVLSTPPLIKKTYREVFLIACGVDPFASSISALRDVAKRYHVDNVLDGGEQEIDQYLFLLMSHVVEPFLSNEDRPVAVYDFPSSQASLAKIRDGVAQRFEVYYRGLELANGFHELTDPVVQAQRFQQDILARQQRGFTSPKTDPWLIGALQAGIPACSGVALGVDRLVALALEKSSISEVLAFDVKRA